MQAKNSLIMVLGTGGTVAGRLDPTSDIPGAYKAGQLPLQRLIDDLSKNSPPENLPPVDVEQVAQIDSKDMSIDLWRALLPRIRHHLQRPEVKGIVIAHGTDTLEETSILLWHVFNTTKPIVLVGAMRPADAPDADGPNNLFDAIVVANDPHACGVLMSMAREIHEGRHVRKTHPSAFVAFGSGDVGPIGRIVVSDKPLQNRRIDWLRTPSDFAVDPLGPVIALDRIFAPWPRVDIVTSHAEADGRIVDLLVKDGVAGLIVAGTGNGTVHQSLAQALDRARRAGVKIKRCTRITSAGLAPIETQSDPEATPLTAAQARIALQLELLKNGDNC